MFKIPHICESYLTLRKVKIHINFNIIIKMYMDITITDTSTIKLLEGKEMKL